MQCCGVVLKAKGDVLSFLSFVPCLLLLSVCLVCGLYLYGLAWCGVENVGIFNLFIDDLLVFEFFEYLIVPDANGYWEGEK